MYSIKFRKYWDDYYIMTLAMIFSLYLHLNVHSKRMAKKAMFESIKSGPSMVKKEDVFWKSEILHGHREKSYRDSQISKTVGKTQVMGGCSLVIKWHKRFLGSLENVMDDVRKGTSSFRNCGAVKIKSVTSLTVIAD